jgi:hypothetical protein
MRDDELDDPGKPENRGTGCAFYAGMTLLMGSMALVAIGMLVMVVTRG